ncbi:MAG: hypothetical protein ILA34_03370 [Bacteroidaceae bacterium]|nr:hypothetical protein [Bacteroidaceae bacterium]
MNTSLLKTALWALMSLLAVTAQAQIGYQVALLNKATGEARAHVTVSAQVSITNAQNETLYSGTQQATTNDFGILSLTVGNENTFRDVDFSKLPFFISVSVDGTLIGKSQILHVPVAEAAKTLVPTVDKELLCNTAWRIYTEKATEEYYDIYRFSSNNTFTSESYYNYGSDGRLVLSTSVSGRYEITGNTIYLYYSTSKLDIARFINNKLYMTTPY